MTPIPRAATLLIPCCARTPAREHQTFGIFARPRARECGKAIRVRFKTRRSDSLDDARAAGEVAHAKSCGGPGAGTFVTSSTAGTRGQTAARGVGELPTTRASSRRSIAGRPLIAPLTATRRLGGICTSSGRRRRAGTPTGGVRLVVLPFDNLSDYCPGVTQRRSTGDDHCRRTVVPAVSASSRGHRDVVQGRQKLERNRQRVLAGLLVGGELSGARQSASITAQLIETRTETHLWADTYDRSVGETLTLQADVAAHIARSLAMELVPDQVDVLGRSTPLRTEEYQAYLKGRYHWNRGGLDGVNTAISYYERALDLDPAFAAAHSAMARARLALANHARQPGRRLLEEARASAIRAIELDPGISDAHLALAEIRRVLEWNWRAAEDEYRTAIALSRAANRARFSRSSLLRCRVAEAKLMPIVQYVDPFCSSSPPLPSGAYARSTLARDRFCSSCSGYGAAFAGPAILAPHCSRRPMTSHRRAHSVASGNRTSIAVSWLAMLKPWRRAPRSGGSFGSSIKQEGPTCLYTCAGHTASGNHDRACVSERHAGSRNARILGGAAVSPGPRPAHAACPHPPTRLAPSCLVSSWSASFLRGCVCGPWCHTDARTHA